MVFELNLTFRKKWPVEYQNIKNWTSYRDHYKSSCLYICVVNIDSFSHTIFVQKIPLYINYLNLTLFNHVIFENNLFLSRWWSLWLYTHIFLFIVKILIKAIEAPWSYNLSSGSQIKIFDKYFGFHFIIFV